MTFAAPLSDVLSGASLVMAVLAAVFAIWQPEVNKALDSIVKPDPQNRGPERKLVASMMWGRVVPLLAVTILAALLLAARSMYIVEHVGMCWLGRVPVDLCSLDEASGLLLLTETLLVVLSTAMAMQLKALADKRAELG